MTYSWTEQTDEAYTSNDPPSVLLDSIKWLAASSRRSG